MTSESIRWRVLERESLPAALFGQSAIQNDAALTLVPSDLSIDRVALGFADKHRYHSYNPPSITVIDDRSAAETFSWLRTFASETSPLSQFGRVVTARDWNLFSSLLASRQINVCREDCWASVILGEALAQGDGEGEPSAMPLSRAMGCFSTAVARTSFVYGSNIGTRECIERLLKLSADPRFVRRAVSSEDLIPIWIMADTAAPESLTAIELVSWVVDTAWKNHFNDLLGVVSPSILREQHGLFSDSIEERVVAFQQISDVLLPFTSSTSRKSFCGVLLAASAFLVGRGTSHEFLLRKLGRQAPTAFVWFGLIAGFAGPRTWDTHWSRATKGIERQVRAKFDWTDSVGSDLYWAEFTWFAHNFENNAVFATLPRMYPKVLSVEVLPGATCQLRLATVGALEVESRPQEPNAREMDLHSALAQVVNLAAKLKPLLNVPSHGAQQTLSLEDGSPYKRSSRAKRPK